MRPRVLTFTVVGMAQPKGSGRAFISKSTGKAVYKAANPKSSGWERTVANCAALELARDQYRGLHFDGPVALTLAFYFARPKDLLRPKYAAVDVPHVKKPDLDKVIRAVADALTGTVWTDDSQIVEVTARKRYVAVGEFPRVVITVRDVVSTAPARQEAFSV